MIQQVLFPDGERNQEILMPYAIQKVAVSIPLLPTSAKEGNSCINL